MVAMVSSVVVGATRAYLSDTETSMGNTINAGTLNLKVDNVESTAVAHVVVDNVRPSFQWIGPEYSHLWVIKNDGSVPGTVTYTIKNVKNWENGCNDPEIKAGDLTCGTGSDQGELGSQFKLLFQINQFGYNHDIYPVVEGASTTPIMHHLNAGETKNVYLRSWWINAANNNLAQGDKLEFDIEFKLNQDHP